MAPCLWYCCTRLYQPNLAKAERIAQMKKISAILFIFFLTGCSAGPVILSPTSPDKTPTLVISHSEEVGMGIRQGNEIVSAIEKHYRDTNRYPDKLDELVPIYMNKIPLTLTGQEYEYKFLGPDSVWGQPYILLFRVQTKKNTNCSYVQRFVEWECNFSFTH